MPNIYPNSQNRGVKNRSQLKKNFEIPTLVLSKMVEEHRSIIERRHAGCILLLLKETVAQVDS